MKKIAHQLRNAAQWALQHSTSFLVGGVAVLSITSAFSHDLSTTITMPNTFSNNSIADAGEVNANFTELKDEIIVNRTAINNLHLAVMANGTEVGTVQNFSVFGGPSSITGQTSQGYSFQVDQNGAIVDVIEDADLSVENILTNSSCSGSAQPTLLVKTPTSTAKTMFRIELTDDPTNPGTTNDRWGIGSNTWNGTYSYEGTETIFSTVSNYALDGYSVCNVTQTFTGPFFQPINYVHSIYSAPDISPLGLTLNDQSTTGVGNSLATPVTIEVRH